MEYGLEHKLCRVGAGVTLAKDGVIEGYASLFGITDQGGDVVDAGAYGASLKTLGAENRAVKMLWQHDPLQPIGVWDEVREDAKGLYVRGRLLTAVGRAAEAAALVSAGAIDGLSIGYRTVRAAKDDSGRRVLKELDLWEVSLVTFPMLPQARVAAKGEAPHRDAGLEELARGLEAARRVLVKG